MARLPLRPSIRRGNAAIEFTLTLVVLLSILLGIVELSLLMSRTYKVSRAARDACRIGSGVIEGVNPTGDLIEQAAEEHAAFVLEAAGIVCAGACEIDANWYANADGWMVLEVDVGVPYEPFTGLLPMIPEFTHSQFVMLTQQQNWD